MLMSRELKMATINAGINCGYANHPVPSGSCFNYMGVLGANRYGHNPVLAASESDIQW